MAPHPHLALDRIVDAELSHLEQIAGIYAKVVLDSPATFDLEAPGVDFWAAVREQANPEQGHFLLVGLDPGGAVLGYAKSGRFRERAAYATTCETSIYVGENARGRGVATELYEGLLERLDASPLLLAVAGMTEPNPASVALHLRVGFEFVGTFERVGVKFDRAWDVSWYQRPLDR